MLLAHLWKMQLCQLARAALGRVSSCEASPLSQHQHSWSIHEPTGSSPWLLLSVSLSSSPQPTCQTLWATTAPGGPQLFSRVALEDRELCSAIPSQAANPARLNNGTKNNRERAALCWIPLGFIKISDGLQFWVLQSSPGCAQSREQRGSIWPGRGSQHFSPVPDSVG